ncbi:MULTISPECIES: caspase family protein [unclassified Psychrobacter]|uniref:caspase family protein n=1 Tax=unclassified Psychrobacter TaxID=196806 RepID=UPI0018837A00|nr:caspase family protein [Psychrobacter sp. NG25]MBF0659531.1 caspase family protein [Psychrobacter sp. NG25]
MNELMQPFSQAHALVIAISKYEGKNELPETVTKDANDIALVLKTPELCGYKESNVTLLLDYEATLSNIRSEINKLATKVQENDTVFIYFSGHGGNRGDELNPDCFLAPVDINSPDGGILPEAELSLLLSEIKSERLLFVIDACHSAGAVRFKSLEQNQIYKPGFTEKSLEKLAKGRGNALLASSKYSEQSIIMPGDQNSLFTKHFLSALKGAAGPFNEKVVKVFNIFEYISEKVPAEATTINHEQHPVFKCNTESNFPVALRCGGIKTVACVEESGNQLSKNSIDTTRDRNLEDMLPELYPEGPLDQEIWQRAGGDTSRLKLRGTGRAQWFSALRILQQGGGGVHISKDSLLQEVKNDFSDHLYFS